MRAAALAQQCASSGQSASISAFVGSRPTTKSPTTTPSTARFAGPTRALWGSSRRMDGILARSSTPGSAEASGGSSSKGFGQARPIPIESNGDDAAAAAAASPSSSATTTTFYQGALRRVPLPPPPPPPPPSQPIVSTVTTIDRRVYDQVAASRTRLASSLSSANAQVRNLKRAAEERDRALAKASRALAAAIRELAESSADAEAAAAAAAHAVSAADRSKKASLLARRLRLAAESASKISEEVDAFVPRRVPLVYSGVAVDVRLVGSFDNWGEGVRLSAVEAERDEGGGSGRDDEGGSSTGGRPPPSSLGTRSSTSDAGGTRFEGDAWLLPGRHFVKWVIDGDQYRLAPDWPTADDEAGSTNNVLVVE